MNVQKIAISKSEALELYRKYKTHQHHETDLDREVKRTYQLIFLRSKDTRRNGYLQRSATQSA